jgi:transcriptional regulator with XRE-family HTH domain
MEHPDQSGRHNGRATSIEDLLKTGRAAAGLSQAELAAKIGVSRPYLSRLERGEYTHPSPLVLARIAQVVHISIDDLYAITGGLLPHDLPSFGPYMHAKHPTWPDTVCQSLEDFYEFVKDKYHLG